jgi:formate hydrogenlyase subunit 4
MKNRSFIKWVSSYLLLLLFAYFVLVFMAVFMSTPRAVLHENLVNLRPAFLMITVTVFASAILGWFRQRRKE